MWLPTTRWVYRHRGRHHNGLSCARLAVSSRTGSATSAGQSAARAREPTTGKVIAELKFAFWQSMFTARHDVRVWELSVIGDEQFSI